MFKTTRRSTILCDIDSWLNMCEKYECRLSDTPGWKPINTHICGVCCLFVFTSFDIVYTNSSEAFPVCHASSVCYREKRVPQGRDGRETRYRNSSHDDRRQSSRQSSRDDGYRNERHKESSGRDDHYSGGGSGNKSAVSERRSETDFFRDRAPRDDQQRNGEKSQSRSSKDWSTEERVSNHKEESSAVDRSKEGQRYQETADERPRVTEKKHHQHWGSDEEVEELAEKIELETKEPCWNQQSAASSYPSRANYSGNPQGHQSYGRAAKDGSKARELDVFDSVVCCCVLFVN